jgi:superfamily II DNA or RNA helicase
MYSEIVERKLGYSDYEMHLYCLRLMSILTMEKPITVKANRKNEQIIVPKFKTEPEIINRLQRSIEYYKENMENKKVEFRDYQLEIIAKGTEVINKYGFVYLAMEVRTGKTLTSLGICENLKPLRILFVTKKKVITNIENDYYLLNPSYKMEVINYESLHKLEHKQFNVIILDEAHSLGAFPKPSNRAKQIKDLIQASRAKVIFLSGTPTPESYSQMFHQLYGLPRSPFAQYDSFYKFAKDYVNVKQKKINSLIVNDYSDGKQKILDVMKPYMIALSQREAGFVSEVEEEVLTIPMPENLSDLIKKLKKDLVVQGKKEVILADTPTKLMSKIHQICSGTVKFESGNSMVLNTQKAEYIKKIFKGKRIGIFYKFKEELNALKQVFTNDEMTTELSVFEDTGCQVIALQIVSGREGISLRNADYIVYYNIDFSATSYWQSRDRMTTKDRTYNKVFWLFCENGIEHQIYKAVKQKKDYTVNHFKKDLLSLI